MPYRYLGDIAIADVAFEAQANTREDLFIEAGNALTNVMVEDLKSIQSIEHRNFHIKARDVERLLFEFLQVLIFYKDAEQLLLRVPRISITEKDDSLILNAEATGEKINPKAHELNADVKAVTLHRFQVRHESEGWKTTVVLDV
jgi:SHS2 domain-containing protein